MKKILLIVAMLVSSQAVAWGDREQGVLVGIAAGYLLNQANQPRQEQVVIIQQERLPTIIRQQPQVIYVDRQPRRLTRGWHYDRNCNCYYEVWHEH